MTDTELIAITGGIGAGKSVISGILRAIGYPVYDSDSRAKSLMDCSEEIKTAIEAQISKNAINPDRTINRQLLARIVFNDPSALGLLNTIVHKAVREDVWEFRMGCPGHIAFVETAILYQSGLDKMVSQVWEVTAPENIRIERVIKRNGISPEDVRKRIASQKHITNQPHPCVKTITNDGICPILPRVESLLNML